MLITVRSVHLFSFFSQGDWSNDPDPILQQDSCACTGSSGIEIVASHSSHVVSTTEYTLTVDRTSPQGMWLTMLSFYKKAIVDSTNYLLFNSPENRVQTLELFGRHEWQNF